MKDVLPLVQAQGLKIRFASPAGPVRAVDGVSFDIPSRAAVALVGESGCGKTLTALSLARLLPQPGGLEVEGRILFDGEDVLRMKGRRLRALRAARIAYVFQDPGVALNPTMRAGEQIAEALRARGGSVDPKEAVARLAQRVGLPDPHRRLAAYPHEMSGGMQQRVMIAMAIAASPALLVADEPTTALDVTIQAQILELIRDLRGEAGLTVLLITHNLGLVAGFCDAVNVMYAGRIVESGATDRILRQPRHPYTRGLLNAVPSLGGGWSAGRRLEGIAGAVPNPARLPAGCKFWPRCSRAADRCRVEEPDLAADGDRRARCWFPIED